jgi:hypothetical protein
MTNIQIPPVPPVSLHDAVGEVAVQSMFSDFIRSDVGRDLVAKRFAEAFDGCIRDALASYKPFAKQLDALIENVLQLPANFDASSYNATVLEIVRRQVEHLTHDTVQKQVGKRMESLLEPAPESIKISELASQYVEQLREEASGDCGCSFGEQRATVGYVIDDIKGFSYMWLHPHPKAERHEADIVIGFYMDHIYNLRFDRITQTDLFAGPLYGFEKLLFQMKAGVTKIVLDVDCLEDVEVFYGHDI